MHSKAGGWRSRLFFERRYLKKESHSSPAVVLFLRVYAPKSIAEYPVINRKESFKSLKIRLPAIKPIDVVLRRTAVTGGPALCAPVMMLFSR